MCFTLRIGSQCVDHVGNQKPETGQSLRIGYQLADAITEGSQAPCLRLVQLRRWGPLSAGPLDART